mgnify:CR=1
DCLKSLYGFGHLKILFEYFHCIDENGEALLEAGELIRRDLKGIGETRILTDASVVEHAK